MSRKIHYSRTRRRRRCASATWVRFVPPLTAPDSGVSSSHGVSEALTDPARRAPGNAPSPHREKGRHTQDREEAAPRSQPAEQRELRRESNASHPTPHMVRDVVNSDRSGFALPDATLPSRVTRVAIQ